MAKLNSLFKYDGTFQGVTVVNSRAYGQHIRKARTAFTLSEGMKESSTMMGQANVYAKAFKDAIDPYRRNFRDGLLWQRLVSLFKKQIQKKGSADFSVLENQDLNKIHPFSRHFSAQTTIPQSDRTLNVKVLSHHTLDPTRGRADGYLQILIILFVDADLQVRSFSESKIIPLKADPGEHQVNFTIPEGSTTAIVVIKSNFSEGNKTMDLQRGMGMRVEKVVGVKY